MKLPYSFQWIGSLFVVLLVVAIQTRMLDNKHKLFSSVAVIFGLSGFVHAILILPTALVHKSLAEQRRLHTALMASTCQRARA